MLEGSFTCLLCNTICNDKNQYLKHTFEVHDALVNLDQINESFTYRNILLCPGIGHVEMNMTKGCFKMFGMCFCLI